MIKIKEQFKNRIYPLSAEEYAQLEENILNEGIREPILTWDNYIVDGHNRYEIAQKHNLKYLIAEVQFADDNECEQWMIKNQFGRRNLSNYQRSVLALELEDLYAKKAKQRMLSGTPVPKLEQGRTIEKISSLANVGKSTIAKVKVIQAKATPEVKQKLSTGEMHIDQAYQEIKKEEKKKNFEEKKKEFEKPLKPINIRQIIINGDSTKILPTLDVNSFDLLLSDPPYGMDFKSGWNEKDKIQNDKIEDTVSLLHKVLCQCVPLLKDDAHFYLFGNIEYLHEVKPVIDMYLSVKNILIWDRQIIGMGDLKSYGKSYDIIYFGYNKKFKELNGTRDRDVLNFNRVDPSKNIHPTEKPLDLLEYLIKKSTKENDCVLDPFAGAGSTLLACKNLNRKATGIEIEEKYFNLITEKI